MIDPVAPTPELAAAPARSTASSTTFVSRLAAEMKRITAHSTKTETLKNGATLFDLADGEVVEQAAGKTPYVVKK